MHIEQEIWKQFHDETLESDQVIKLLEHTVSCDYCMNQMSALEKNNQMQAPCYLKSKIMSRVLMPDIKIEQHTRHMSKRMELWLYSLRTLTAVTGALLILFLVNRVDIPSIVQYEMESHVSDNLTNRLTEGSDHVANYFNQFSNHILNGGKE